MAARVRQLREGLGLTREGLEERSGVSWSFIRDVEQAKSEPGAFKLKKLARGLGVSVEELVGGSQPVELDGLAFLDMARVKRILSAEKVSDLDDLTENGTLFFGASFSADDRIVSREEFLTTEARCHAYYTKLSARERRRR